MAQPQVKLVFKMLWRDKKSVYHMGRHAVFSRRRNVAQQPGRFKLN